MKKALKSIIIGLACLILICVLIVTIPILVVWINSYEVEYPETYTVEYCKENYVEVNPKIEVFKASDNSVENTWWGERFRAIKDVPLEEYLYYQHHDFSYGTSQVVRNKNLVLPEDDILYYEYESLELYAYGEHHGLSNKRLEKITGSDADSFRAYIRECLESKNFNIFEGDESKYLSPVYVDERLPIVLKIKFSEYPNLGWRSAIYQLIDGAPNDYFDYFFDGDPNYYFVFWRLVLTEDHEKGYFYQSIWLPLPEEIAKLIPET